MKKLPIMQLAIACLFCCFASSISAQDKSMSRAFPELKKPIVQMSALERTSVQSSDFTIIAVCSQTKLGIAEAFVTRPGQMKSSDNIRLDVTVFKQGFATDKYAVLYKSNKTKAFDLNKFARNQFTKSLDLTSVALRPEEQNQNVLYKLEGLEPGLNYFWRVSREGRDSWESTEVIRIEAPTCPVDSVEPK